MVWRGTVWKLSQARPRNRNAVVCRRASQADYRRTL